MPGEIATLGVQCMKRYPVAFSLGIGSFLVFWATGEYLASTNPSGAMQEFGGILVLAALVGAYAFLCQRFLSRGDARPAREQWRVLLCFNSVLTAFALAVPIFVHKWIPALVMFGLAAYSWACSYAGAALAARAARRK